MTFKVPSNPNYAMILWTNHAQLQAQLSVSIAHLLGNLFGHLGVCACVHICRKRQKENSCWNSWNTGRNQKGGVCKGCYLHCHWNLKRAQTKRSVQFLKMLSTSSTSGWCCRCFWFLCWKGKWCSKEQFFPAVRKIVLPKEIGTCCHSDCLMA